MSRVLFGGKALREPTAASRLRIGVQPAVNPNATNRVAVIGPSEGGLPQTVYTFSSFAEARDVLRSGDSLRAINFIFNPSPAYGGAAQVDFIRADQATAASKNIVDATGGTPKTAFSVTSVDKGTWVNGIMVQVAAQSTNRTVTVKVPGATVQSGIDGVGTVSGSVFTSASAKFISRGAGTGDLIVVRNSGATTVTVYTIATVVSETDVTVSETVTAGTALIWDHMKAPVSRVSPTLAATGGTTNVNANIVNWINTYCSDVVTAALVDADATLVAATTGNNPLTGGTVTAMTLTDIENALVLLQPRAINHLYVAKACGTDNSAGEINFAGSLAGHILNNAEIPALAYIGAAKDKTAANAITFAGTLNSGRLVYTHQTVFDASVDGLSTEEVPGYLLAAKVAGLAAGLETQTPLTRKQLNLLGIKGGNPSKATRESLLAAGVLHVFQPVGTNTFVINQGVTTLQKNDELWDAATAQSSEISLMRIVDAILTDLRKSAASTFIGQTSTLAKPVVEHFAQSYLQSKVGSLLQSYAGVTVTQQQDKWFIELGIVPAYPINFVLITGTVIG